ncbi:hypothetical protein FF011L_39720 [Roseimaritima multifibrata]|uniref:Transporter n=1 Tax=Roseimaritima multifibrata TaxID=1930274 RepID=A0A517MJW0_9BACT|nr:transporter [Roseimaritima multifibrata]QDS95181.1 hypothetical protein FF011L_39720 [Roseimaritima multifibrata]
MDRRLRFVVRLAASVGLSILACAANGQEEREIETDRDSFTPALSTVDKGLLMVESSYSFVDNRNAKETHSFPELLLRFGATENFELRFGTNYEIGGESSTTSGSGGFEFEPGGSANGLEEEAKVLYGFKLLLQEQDGWRPQSNVTVMGQTPTAGESTATQLVTSATMGWEFSDGWELASALRYATGSLEEDDFNIWAPSVVLKIPLGERTKVHAEYFGLFSDGQENATAKSYFSPGVHYLLTPDLEVGVRTGWGFNQQSANFFSNVGFGWQF